MNANPRKQSMSELKLRRLTEHSQRLREDLARPRVRVSEASARYVICSYKSRCRRLKGRASSLIRYCKTTEDHLVSVLSAVANDPSFTSLTSPRFLVLQVPSVWGPLGKSEDPYAPPEQGCNCVLM